MIARTAAFGEGISRSPEGLIQVEGQKFGIAFWEQNWKTSASQLFKPEIATFPGEEGIRTPEGIRRDGTFRISDRYEFHLAETFLQTTPEKLQLHFTLTSETGIPSAIICWHTLVPDNLYVKAPALYNGKPIPCERKKQLVQCRSAGNDSLTLNLKQGRLVITGTFNLTVRRNEWGFTEVRLSFSHPWGKIRRSELKVSLNYTPYSGNFKSFPEKALIFIPFLSGGTGTFPGSSAGQAPAASRASSSSSGEGGGRSITRIFFHAPLRLRQSMKNASIAI